MSDTFGWQGRLRTECRGLLQRFEEAWRGPARPDLRAYLPAAAPDRGLLFELIHIDLDFRLRLGERARVEDYLTRFPELEHDRAGLVDLIAAEYALRRCWGTAGPQAESIRVEEYLSRFPRYDELRDRLAADPTVSGRPRPLRPLLTPAFPGYEVMKELGRGGMGVVYQARHLTLNRIVALKT